MFSARRSSAGCPSTVSCEPWVRMSTFSSDPMCLRFASWAPYSVSMPSSGSAIRFIGSKGVVSYLEMKLLQLLWLDGRRRTRHQIDGRRRLRERHHLADRVLAGEDGHHAVQAERDAAMRGRAVLERIQEKPEAELRFL